MRQATTAIMLHHRSLCRRGGGGRQLANAYCGSRHSRTAMAMILRRQLRPVVQISNNTYTTSTRPVLGYLAGCCFYNTFQQYSNNNNNNNVSSCEHAIVSYPSKRREILVVEAPAPPRSWKQLGQKLRRAWRLLMRMIKLSFTLAPVTLFYPILLLNNRRRRDDANKDAHAIVTADPGAEQQRVSGFLGWYLGVCLTCVEWSGAAVIKLMQWAGSRPDLFGHDFCSVFSQLQDSTTPHRWKHTEKVLREAYGDNWRERIKLGEILGSGCIGQVYHGYVRTESGEEDEVAVKVLHPNVEEDIDADLDLMRLAVRAAKWMPFDVFANLKWLNMEGIVEEFADLLKLQLDLQQEAANLERFNENFKDEKAIVFPKLVPGYAPTKDVLIETYCEGVPVVQFARENREDQAKLHSMCLSAIRAVCKMIFLDNFMHGDLHPGNVFVSPDGEKFILFDVGIVAEYSNQDHAAIVDILGSFIRKQGRKAGRLMIDDSNSRLRASQSNDAAVNEELYIDKIEALTIKASTKGYLMEHLGKYITYICNAAAQHHIMMNPSFVTAALAVKVQEGIALSLDPSIEICRVAIPIIVESERRRHVAFAREKLTMKNILSSIFGEKKDENI